MRYGVIADVHGNRQALVSTLDFLRGRGVDGVLCAGDIVGFGASPNECVELLVEAGAQSVAGNHELIVLGELTDERCGHRARSSLTWTREVLRDDVRRHLTTLPRELAVPGVTVTHGALGDPQEYVRSDASARAQLAALGRQDPGTELLVLGHTHRTWLFHEADGTVARRPGTHLLPPGRHLVNPGSVGQSRQRERTPRARCAVIDVQARRVDLHAVPYDVDACREDLRRAGLGEDHIHLVPHRVRDTLRDLRRSVRRVGARATSR